MKKNKESYKNNSKNIRGRKLKIASKTQTKKLLKFFNNNSSRSVGQAALKLKMSWSRETKLKYRSLGSRRNPKKVYQKISTVRN